MKREEILKLYTREVETDPETGKERAVLRYIGPYYRMESGALKALKRMGWLVWVLTLTAMVWAGLIPTRAGNALYVQAWYLFTLLPFFYLLLGLLRMRKVKEQFNAIDKAEGYDYLKASAWGLAGLGGLWAGTSVIFLVLNGLQGIWGNDVIFLACGAVIAMMGLALARAMSRTNMETMNQQ